MTKEAQSDTNTPSPILSNSPKHDLKKDYEPLEGGCTLPNLINKILKNPLSIIHELEMKKNAGKITCLLLLIATVSFSVFGIIVGTFSWNDQIWAAPLKIVCGLLFSGFICLPSLYIFTSQSLYIYLYGRSGCQVFYSIRHALRTDCAIRTSDGWVRSCGLAI